MPLWPDQWWMSTPDCQIRVVGGWDAVNRLLLAGRVALALFSNLLAGAFQLLDFGGL